MAQNYVNKKEAMKFPLMEKKDLLATAVPQRNRQKMTETDYTAKQFRNQTMLVDKHEKLLENNKKRQKAFSNLMIRHNKLYLVWRRFDLITGILSTISLILALTEYEIGYFRHIDERDYLTTSRNIFRLLTLIFSLLSVCTIIIRYYYKRKWQNLPIPPQVQNQIYNNDYTVMMRKNRRKTFISFKL